MELICSLSVGTLPSVLRFPKTFRGPAGACWWGVWIGLHFGLAAALVVMLVDRMELIDQTAMPAACEAYLEFRPSETVYSEWTFALRCWDAGNFIQFLAVAVLAVGLVLFPFTFIATSRRRGGGIR